MNDVRIDGITLVFDAYGSAGRVEQRIEVPMTEIAFVAACREQWEKAVQRDVGKPNDIFVV
jgi:hypothetical protein